MSGKNFATKYDGSLGISFGDIIKRETYREMERELTAKLSISSSKVIVASGVSHTPTYRDDINCMRCGICQVASPNRAVIGFPAHGVKKRVIDIKLMKE